MTSPSIPDLNDAEAGPTEQGREGARLGGERCLRSACRAEPPGAAPRVPPALTPGSRAPPPLCRGRPPDPAPVPSAPLRCGGPGPAAARSPYLGAPACRAGRAGLSAPAAALLKKPERAAPLSFYVRARGEAPTPGAPAAAPGQPALPPSLRRAAPAASVLRSSAPPVPLSLRTPGPPGGQAGSGVASSRGEAVRWGGWKSNDPGTWQSCSPPLARSPSSAASGGPKGRKRAPRPPTLGLKLSAPGSAPRHLACCAWLLEVRPSTPEQESVWHN